MKKRPCSTRRAFIAVGAIMALTVPLARGQENSAAPDPRLPTLFIIGDSTVSNHANGMLGWGDPIKDAFDAKRITVLNRARGGRSSRTFFDEGLWEKVRSELKPGDFVLMQFGHNDAGKLDAPKTRASLPGVGEETQEITDTATGKKTVVHTFGWYLRRYITDTRAKGATPVALSMVPRNRWKDDHTLVRADNDFGKWSSEAARKAGAEFIDLNALVAKRYEALGPEKVKAQYFGPLDNTHTSSVGARLNASSVVEGIQGLENCPLAAYLLPTR